MRTCSLGFAVHALRKPDWSIAAALRELVLDLRSRTPWTTILTRSAGSTAWRTHTVGTEALAAAHSRSTRRAAVVVPTRATSLTLKAAPSSATLDPTAASLTHPGDSIPRLGLLVRRQDSDRVAAICERLLAPPLQRGAHRFHPLTHLGSCG